MLNSQTYKALLIRATIDIYRNLNRKTMFEELARKLKEINVILSLIPYKHDKPQSRMRQVVFGIKRLALEMHILILYP